MKKNHLNSFLRQYGDYVYEPITVDNTEETKAALAEWFARHGDIEEEKQAISLAFANWEALGMRGAVIRIYGRIEALTMGASSMNGWPISISKRPIRRSAGFIRRLTGSSSPGNSAPRSS